MYLHVFNISSMSYVIIWVTVIIIWKKFLFNKKILILT
jgi:hypothetical protein